MSLDLDKPIIVHYIDVGGLTRQKAMQNLAEYSKQIQDPSINSWVVPASKDQTRIEIIWKGNDIEKLKNIKDLCGMIDEYKEDLSEVYDIEELKKVIRNIKLEKLL